MGKLTTHVLDTAAGKPAEALALRLYRDGSTAPLVKAVTNADGRVDASLLEGEALQEGRYRLEFEAADYFRRQGVTLPSTPFLDEVVIAFGISDPDVHYHVPLLISPYGYSTYRGS